MTTLNQRSFTGGEVAPSLYARVDQSKYQNGAKTMRNYQVMRHGGVQNRPGTEYIGSTKGDAQVRLIPFVFSDTQAYVLEFGEGYIRLFQDGAAVGPGTVSAWADAAAYKAGDLASYSGTNYWCRNAHTSATANDRPSTGTNWQKYWYAMPAGVLEIASPYAQADLAALKFTQSADVMTFVHADYDVFELSRLSNVNWSMRPMQFQSEVGIPLAVSNNGAAAQAQQQISAVTQANPAVITVTGHGMSSGDRISLVVKWTKYSGAYNIYWYYTNAFAGTITSLSGDTFSIVPEGESASWNTSSGFSGWTLVAAESYIVKTGTSAAALAVTQYVVTAVSDDRVESVPSLVTGTSSIPTSAANVTVSWTGVSGVKKYNIYKRLGAVFGFIGTADRTLFTDNGITPDSTLTAPFTDPNIFQDADAYPSCVGYYQQRLFFGNSNNKTETVWASRTGDFRNFSKRQPLQDDDSIEFSLAGRQVAQIKHIMDIGKLLVFASTGEYFCNGDAAGIITPTDINVRQHSNFGSSDVPPIQVGNNAIFVQARGSLVRDLGFDWQTEGYKGNDLTIFSAHLFDGYTISEWCYQQIPHSIIWAVRSDGTLLGLTYLPEHQIWGWHRHDTDGTFESICTVPDSTSNEDAVYVVVNRTIDGSTKRYIEKFASRQIDEEDFTTWHFIDCYSSYDGRNVGATTMTLSGSGWTSTDPLTLTASASEFVVGDVGNQYWLTGADGTVIRCTVNAYTSATVVTVLPHMTVPVAMRAVATATWTKAVDELTGLDYLEGENVAVFADGFVVASPNNSAYTTVTVTSGTITLDKPHGVIRVGLPYLCDLQTLDIDTVQGETMVDKKKLVGQVWVYTEKTRGLWAGSSEPSANATDGLNELKKRSAEGYDDPVDLSTGVEEITIRPEWNSNGRVFLRQVDPLPIAILAVAPKGLIPLR